ncbi:RHS repeat domain-containing protein [Bacteroides sp. 519]|uniref:RHS repeat domain-containing protein n=1 Tax=Bacteroides sp. 519 TaxID=2302937 RepID=UPI003519E19A|nr:RHS repeat-associated core domain-containing protein [Bacteroides sp. 519]
MHYGTGNGEQAAKTTKEWTFYLYDAFDRQVLQGTCTNTNTASVASTVVTTSFAATNTGIGSSGYTSSFTITLPTVHQVNYYDDYRFRSLTGFNNNTYFPAGMISAKGLQTGSVTTVLDSSTKLYSANYYDTKGRVICAVSSNHLGGYDKITTSYTFTGKPKMVNHEHTASGKTTQIQVYNYTYDHSERLKTLIHRLNSGNVTTLVNNTYDNLGRLQKNSRNGVANLADSYTYNVRSWITKIAGTQFTENLTYKHAGNVATMQWLTNGQTRNYTYTYDPLSRLTAAAYTGPTAEKYQTVYTYDKHGNIKTLQRYGKTTASAYGLVDNLTMTYAGNQLTNVADAGTTVTLAESNDFKKGSTANPGYAYNKNGSMIKDLNKKISSISYNSLNLPKSLVINGVTHTYTYAADGRKLRVVQGNTNRDYAGNIIYENGSLKRILVDGGYIEGSTYYFYLNDHLGNTRAVANASGTAIQRDHYYPFGLPMAITTSAEQDKQPYKYNGKEFERKDGLNWYDYSARQMDPSVGRFTTMDPMAEKYYSVSPYAYCNNNPMRFVDPDGREHGEPDRTSIWTWLKSIFTPQIDTRDRTKEEKEQERVAEMQKQKEAELLNKDVDNLSSKAISGGLMLTSFVLGDDVTGIGTVDDVLIPAIWATVGMAILYEEVVSSDKVKDNKDEFAHKKKKQSTGKSKSDRHDAQYTHGGKKRPENPNKRRGADERRNNGKNIN